MNLVANLPHDSFGVISLHLKGVVNDVEIFTYVSTVSNSSAAGCTLSLGLALTL